MNKYNTFQFSNVKKIFFIFLLEHRKLQKRF